MKTIQFVIFLVFSLSLCINALAQTKTETFAVSGECGMCKKKIEAAAKTAGASYADWNVASKQLTVKYSASSNAAKIQQSVAGAGYNTPTVKATDAAYNSLNECCKYDRTPTTESNATACCAAACCSKEARCCTDEIGCTNGNCIPEATSTAFNNKSTCCATH